MTDINKKNKKGLFKKMIPFLLILLLAQTTQVFAGYDKMPVTGNGRIKLSALVKDTKNVTNYSGVEYMRYKDSFGSTNSSWSNYIRITNRNGVEIPEVNDGEVTMPSVQLMDTEGIHNVCIQLKDHADTVHGLGGTPNNETDGTSNESASNICTNIFYDKTKPSATKIELNKGNHWINKGEIPVSMVLVENRAGIDKITYDNGFGGRSTIPDSDIKCTQNTDPASGDGSWACTVNSTLITNDNRASGNMYFQMCDKVGNCNNITKCSGSYKDSCVMDYDKIIPTGTADIKNYGDNTNGSNANVDIHLQDLPGDVWTKASGIETVTISNLDGSNEKVLVNKANDPDPAATFDAFIQEYLTTQCPATVSVTITDKAGNVSVINSIPRGCTIAKIKELRVLDVVNPKLYTLVSPFQIQDWNFINNPQHLNPGEVTAVTPYGTLPSALSGGNIKWDAVYQWDGDSNYKLNAYYTVKIYNTFEGYSQSFTNKLTINDFTKEGTNTYRLNPQTFAVPKDAPSSKNNNHTYVAISLVIDITTVEGGATKTQTIMFTEQDYDADGYGRIAEVVGSIDDYVYFGEIN